MKKITKKAMERLAKNSAYGKTTSKKTPSKVKKTKTKTKTGTKTKKLKPPKLFSRAEAMRIITKAGAQLREEVRATRERLQHAASHARAQAHEHVHAHRLPVPIEKIVIWNTANGCYQIDGIAENEHVVCSVVVEQPDEAAQIGLRFSTRTGQPCYWMTLSWLTDEKGDLSYLPRAVKPIASVITKEGAMPAPVLN
jgi:hypothetical protein